MIQMKKRFLLFCLYGFPFWLMGQGTVLDTVVAAPKDTNKVRFNVCGMNLTPLLNSLIPFQTPTTRVGPYNFVYRRYANNTAFRMGLGLRLVPAPGFNDPNRNLNHFNARIGFEKRRQLYKNLYYTGGLDAVGFVNSFNLPGTATQTPNPFFFFQDAGIGLGATMGLEYFLLPQLSISTEGMMFLGIRSETGFGVEMVPPVSVFVNAYLPKKRVSLEAKQ